MVIPPQYDESYKHAEGMAAVKAGRKWGFVDKAGKMVIPAQYDNVLSFSNGLAEVSVGKKWGYIDNTGKYVWEPTK